MKKSLALTLASLLIAANAAAHTLHVPFFFDNPIQGVAGFIGVKNTTANPIVLNLVYTSFENDGDLVIQPTQQYTIAAGFGVSWRPVAVNDPSEGAGSAVPDVFPGSSNGGALAVIWTGGDNGALSIVGRYTQTSSAGSFSHVLSDAN